MLESLETPEIDVLYRTAGAFRADDRADKVDLGVGVYRDEQGLSPVMGCVRKAEERLCQTNDSKAYLPLAGAPSFIEGMSTLLFGGARPANVAAVQSVGGTGGIRLALELAQKANPDMTVHLGVPSWPNHEGICRRLNIPVAPYENLSDDRTSASRAHAQAAIGKAKAGDVLILHGPCHNPTGLDLTNEEVAGLVDFASEKGVAPLIDAAYYGLGNDLDSDLKALRNLAERASECFLSMSGSKAFGMYRDRIGILFAKCADAPTAKRAQSNAELLARVNYSAPAAHGAQVIGTILADEVLTKEWHEELAFMRARLTQLRAHIMKRADDHPALRSIWHTKGIFALLPFGAEVTERLASEYAIFMPPSGRVNLAGLSLETAERFVEAITVLVPRGN